MIKSRFKKIVSSLLALSMMFSMGFGTSLTAFAAEGDGKGAERYTVTLDEECENGKIEFDQETDGTFAEGDEVDLKLIADDGYVPASLTISETESGNEVTKMETSDDIFAFVMPKGSLTVSAEFAQSNNDIQMLSSEIQTFAVSVGDTVYAQRIAKGLGRVYSYNDSYTSYDESWPASQFGINEDETNDVFCLNGDDTFHEGYRTVYDGTSYLYDAVLAELAIGTLWIDDYCAEKNISEDYTYLLKQCYVWRMLGEGYDGYYHYGNMMISFDYVSKDEQLSIYDSAKTYADENKDKYEYGAYIYSSGALETEVNQTIGSFWATLAKGKAELTKSSANTSITEGNSCYDLAGAQYTLYEDEACTTAAKDVNGNDAVLTTTSDGTTNTLEMYVGTYYVKETKAATGYYLDDGTYSVTIESGETSTVSVKDEPGSDPLRISIEKIDSATGKSQAQGAGSLEGAEFTIKYYDGYYDSVSNLPEIATRTWVLKTTKDTNAISGEIEYRALLDSDHFVSGDDFYYEGSEPTIPLGTITIEETKAPEGYKIGDLTSSTTGDTSSIFISKVELDTDIGKVVAGNEYEGTDEIKRTELKFEKKDFETQERMANVEFRITSETTGESHIIWTDANGQFDSTAVPHSQNTDAGESSQDGIWFYGTADESEGAPVDDSLGAFPYDTYLIEELPCDANEGKELVTVHYDSTPYADGYVEDYGTIDNKDKMIDLETTLVNGWEGEHDEHEATVFENANITLIDTVHYTGLTEGKTYTMKGVLMDKSTGEVVLDDDGNEVRAEKDFTAEAEEGDVEIEFSFPASTLSYTDVVAYEYLYKEGEDEPIGSHEDLNDVNQSVHLRRPTLWTEATEAETGNKYVEATDDVTIIDMLDITDLLVGHTYWLYGKAVDKETGEIVLDENGDPIELTKEFVAESEEALLDVMQFHIDALGMEGKSIVFEEYLFADEARTILICEEEDLGSAEQTITFLSPIDLETTLIDAETESHSSVQDDHVVLVDTVEYEGAIVGETYTMTGTLMDKATGEAVHNLDGSDVTATTEFVAEEESGEVKMTFEFDATGLEDGDATVAYEQMFNSEGTLVGSHEDIDDEGQTVHFPEIHTNATDSETGTNVTEADDEAIIVDTVTYEGLTPGQEYTVEGTLMNKANGEAVVNADGEPVTGSTTFTPEEADGTVEVTFTLDASDLGGSTLVVFEDLLVNEVVVATHADLSDEDQTIYVPDIQTTATDAYDGDHEVEADGTVTIIDTVDYENLIPGQEYTMHGELMDENTGDSLGISNEVTFTPEEADGSVEIEFTFDASDMAGYTTVVFEKLYMTTENGDQVEVAKHEDLTDEGQTVYLAAPPTTSTPESTPTETYSSPSETPEKVQTGDNDMMYLLALMATVCMACGFGLCYRRREDN